MSQFASVSIVDKSSNETPMRRRLLQFFSSKRKLIPSGTSALSSSGASTVLLKPSPLTVEESSAWLASANFDTAIQHGERRTHNSIARMDRESQSLLKELIEEKKVSTEEASRLMNSIESVAPLNRRHELDHDLMLVVGELQRQSRLGDKNDYAGMLISLMSISTNLSGGEQPQRISSQEELRGKAALTVAFTRWRNGLIPDSANYKLNSSDLTEFIFAYPEDLDRLLAYVDARGMNNDSDFKAFMESLNVPTLAIQSGWL